MDIPQAANLPKDARVVYAEVDFRYNRIINFLIESEEFDEVPEGYAYPICQLEMTTVRVDLVAMGQSRDDNGFLVGFIDGTEKVRQMVEDIANTKGDVNDLEHETRVETARQISNNIRLLQFDKQVVADAKGGKR